MRKLICILLFLPTVLMAQSWADYYPNVNTGTFSENQVLLTDDGDSTRSIYIDDLFKFYLGARADEVNTSKTINAADYSSIHDAAAAVTDSTLFVIPAGHYPLDAAITILNRNNVVLQFSDYAYMYPSDDYPTSSGDDITLTADATNGDTIIYLATDEIDRLYVGLSFRLYENAGGEEAINNTHHYRIKTIDEGTGEITFYPELNVDFDPVNDYGFTEDPSQRGTVFEDTIFTDGTIRIGDCPMLWIGRNSSKIKVEGGTWSGYKEAGYGGSTYAGAGAMGLIFSTETHGIEFNNMRGFMGRADFISPQEDDKYTFIHECRVDTFNGNGYHFGGGLKHAVISNSVATNCKRGLYYCYGVHQIIVSNNLFIDSELFGISDFGNYLPDADHNTTITGNIIDRVSDGIGMQIRTKGRDAIIMGNHIKEASEEGVFIGDETDPEGINNIQVLNNSISFCGYSGIRIENIEGGIISGNIIYNNGTDDTQSDSLRSGIFIDTTKVEKVIISDNFCFNHHDGGYYDTFGEYFQIDNGTPQSQQYGIYVTGEDGKNIYQNNSCYYNSTSDYNLTLKLSSTENFRDGAIPWNKGTLRWNDADGKLYVWDGSNWDALY